MAWELGFIVNPSFVANTPFGEAEVCNEAMILNPMTLTYSPSRETARDCDVVKDRADLGIQKILPQETTPAGQTFVYTIMVDNYGPSDARGVRILDDVLSSGAFTLAGPIGSDRAMADLNGAAPGSCIVTAFPGPNPVTEIECALIGPLEPHGEDAPAPAQSGRWILRIPLVAQDAQSMVNKACVSTEALQRPPEGPPGDWQNGTPDPDTSNNCAEDPVIITAVADLDIDKDDNPNAAVAGGLLTYEIRVNNSGPSTATGVRFVDTLPAGVTLVNINVPDGPGDCEIEANGLGITTVTCALGNLSPTGPGSSRRIDLVVRLDPDLSSGLAAQWCLRGCGHVRSGHQQQLRPRRDAGQQPAQIDIEKFADGDPELAGLQGTAVAGEEIEYAIALTNNGPSTARNLVLRDSFDVIDLIGQAPVELLSFNIQGGDGYCYQENVYVQDLSPTQVRCNLGDLPPNTGDTPQRIVHLRFRLLPDAAAFFLVFPAPLNNCVFLESNTPGMTQNPALECATLNIVYEQDVDITKSVKPDTAVTGEVIEYTVKVTNNGPSTAFDAVLIDTVPDYLEFLYASDPACIFVGAPPGTLKCPAGNLAPGEMYSVTYYMRVPADYPCAEPIVANQARVEWDGDKQARRPRARREVQRGADADAVLAGSED